MKWLLLLLIATLGLSNCAPQDADAIVLRQRSRIKGKTGGYTRFPPLPAANPANTYSATLDASAERITCADPWSGNYTGLTIAFWIKPTAIATTRVITRKTTAREFVVQTDTSDASILRFSPGSSSSNYCSTGTGALVNGAWAHFVVTWRGDSTAANAQKCFIYKNGVNVTATYTGTIQDSITDGSAVIEINGDTGLFLGAAYDEMAYWREFKDPLEVKRIYNNGVVADLKRFKPTLWYRMGDDPGDEFDVAATEVLVDQMGVQNCTPIATEGADKTADVP